LTLFRELEDQGKGDLFLPAAGSVPLSGGAGFSLYRLAWIANLQGEYASARVLAEESLPSLKAAGNSFGLSQALGILASAALNQGDYASARAFLAELLTLSQANGIKRIIGTALCLQGQLAFLQGEMSRAHTLLAESIALLKEIVSSWMPFQNNLAEALSILGRVVTRQGDFARAQTLHEESLAAARHMANPHIVAFSLEGLAEMVVQGKPVWAARLWGAAEFLREANGTPLPAMWHSDYEHSVAAARSSLGEQAFSAHWAAGRTLPLEQALADQEPVPLPPPANAVVPPPVSPASAAGLTPREMDVLRLLTQGLTSAQIAEQLVIGLVTVNSHVRSIYSKLGVTSRSAATRYAIEHHLL
jgi:ATP/maltotriose-dependent transcriptional regulator MalT